MTLSLPQRNRNSCVPRHIVSVLDSTRLDFVRSNFNVCPTRNVLDQCSSGHHETFWNIRECRWWWIKITFGPRNDTFGCLYRYLFIFIQKHFPNECTAMWTHAKEYVCNVWMLIRKKNNNNMCGVMPGVSDIIILEITWDQMRCGCVYVIKSAARKKVIFLQKFVCVSSWGSFFLFHLPWIKSHDCFPNGFGVCYYFYFWWTWPLFQCSMHHLLDIPNAWLMTIKDVYICPSCDLLQSRG